jgi:arginase
VTPIDLITVPYDSGLRAERTGRGPLHLLASGLPDRLADDGHDVRLVEIESGVRFRIEAAAAVDLQRRVADAVRAARARGALPLVLSGNCSTALGSITALGSDVAVVWFDAHADFNTPDTSPSGFFDGMALAMATGRCWHALAATLPGFTPLDDRQVVLAGVSDIDPAEQRLLDASRITRIGAEAFHRAGAAALDEALDTLRAVSDRVYLHIDLDVHDAAEAPANGYSAPGGLSRAQVLDGVERIASRFEIGAVALTAYDPEFDRDGLTAGAAIELARTVARRTPPADHPAS